MIESETRYRESTIGRPGSAKVRIDDEPIVRIRLNAVTRIFRGCRYSLEIRNALSRPVTPITGVNICTVSSGSISVQELDVRASFDSSN